VEHGPGPRSARSVPKGPKRGWDSQGFFRARCERTRAADLEPEKMSDLAQVRETFSGHGPEDESERNLRACRSHQHQAAVRRRDSRRAPLNAQGCSRFDATRELKFIVRSGLPEV
jgi:hypothetical protein